MEDAHTGIAPPAPQNGTPRPVDLREIDDAIKQLRMERNVSSTQTYILNLVVFAGAEANADFAQSVAAAVAACYPSRAVIVHTVRGDEGRVDAAITVATDASGAYGHSGSEEIILHAVGDGVRQVAATALTLLIPDIPVVLWWPGESPFVHPTFNVLMDASDQLIVDSARFEDTLAMLERMQSLAHDEYAGVIFTDLAWLRVVAWRELTAQFFDAATTRPYLDNVQRVSITYAVQPGLSVQPVHALLLGSWLATRLGWEAVPNLRRLGREILLVLRQRETPVTIECSARPMADIPNGAILSVTLHAQAGDSGATFNLERSTDDANHIHATATIEGQPPQERVLPVGERDAADIICDEVSAVRRDHIYEEALRFLVHLTGSGAAR